MNIPCPHTINCDCSDNPLTNFSSEIPDERVYRALSWLQVQPRIGRIPRLPPRRPPVICSDPTSPLYARLCADRISIITTNSQNDSWPNRVPPVLFYSQQSTCQVACIGGGVFEMQVAAGQFVGQDPTTVNAQAAALACELAVGRKICLGALTGSACLDFPYDETLIVSSDAPVSSLVVVGGTLPPGIGIVPLSLYSFRFVGIPDTAGTYLFTLRATNAFGNYMERNYSIRVLAVAEDSLPDATEGSPYLEYVNGVGGTAPYTFALTGGAFPAGITLNPSGTLQGTPTDNGDFSCTISVTDSSEPAITCSKDFTLHVDPNTANPDAWWPFEDLVIPPFIDTVNAIQMTTLVGGLGIVSQTAGKVGARALLLRPNMGAALTQTVTPSSPHLITSNGFTITGWFNFFNYAVAGDVGAFIFNIYNGVWTNGGINPPFLVDCRFQWDPVIGAEVTFQDAFLLDLLPPILPAYAPTGAFEFVAFGYDLALGQTFFSLNNGALQYSGGSYALALAHTTGRIALATARQTAGLLSASFDEVNYHNKALTPAEIAAIWNGGAGRTYP